MSKNLKKILIISIVIVATAVLGIVVINRTPSSSSDLLQECNQQFENSRNSIPEQERIYVRDICYTNTARESQADNICNQIQDKKLKDICLLQTYYWNKTVEFCESDDRRDICLHTISIKNQDKNICSKIKNDSIRDICNEE